MGIEHGLYCVGGCWLLMGLLFARRRHDLLWVAAVAAFVLVEKLMPYGETTAKVGGVVLLLFAAYSTFSA